MSDSASPESLLSAAFHSDLAAILSPALSFAAAWVLLLPPGPVTAIATVPSLIPIDSPSEAVITPMPPVMPGVFPVVGVVAAGVLVDVVLPLLLFVNRGIAKAAQAINKTTSTSNMGPTILLVRRRRRGCGGGGLYGPPPGG